MFEVGDNVKYIGKEDIDYTPSKKYKIMRKHTTSFVIRSNRYYDYFWDRVCINNYFIKNTLSNKIKTLRKLMK
jgi:hypothetical protein